MQLALTARQPFNFSSVVNSHGWVQLAPCSFDQGSGLFTYLDRLSSGRAVEYRIRAAVEGVQVETEKLREAERAEAAARVSWMLGLDMDFSAFYAACRKEPKLRNAEKQAKGRVLRSPTLFEDVVKTILTTNTVWGATKRMNANLIAQFGEPLPGDETRRAFPTPERLAAAGPEVLRDTVKLGYRAPYVHELAVRVARGELELELLKASALPTLELRKELMNMKGIGPYAAANLLLILGRSDFIPIDTWALKLVSHEWYDGGPVTPKEVEAAFEEWGEFKGLAFWFWDWKYTG